MLAVMPTEFIVPLLEARNTLGTLVMAAAYGDGRFIIRRYGKTVAALVGHADLEKIRDLDEAERKAAPAVAAEPEKAPDPLDEIRKQYERDGFLPWPRTDEEHKLQFELAKEIGERLLKAGAAV
jgi:hypothetical protein